MQTTNLLEKLLLTAEEETSLQEREGENRRLSIIVSDTEICTSSLDCFTVQLGYEAIV